MNVWRRRAVGVALVLLVLPGLTSGCKRKHVAVDTVPELGFPACGDGGADEAGSVAGQGHLRAGPTAADQNVAERFELRRTPCGYTFHSRQEWPLAIADVEVRFDASLTPLWAWKRLTIAGSTREDGNADTRRYELRTGDVFIKHRDAGGKLTMEKLLPGGRMPVPEGAKVGAVVGPGRGVITAWIQRAKLPVGGKTKELVLDFRDMIESLEVGTLERVPDVYEPSLGKSVRAYTFFGKETVFADENDVVIGDLAGMRPSDTLKTPEPPDLPMYGEPDPVHTP
ncbi:MAG: hypothetical protein ABSE49_03220 [Polyangiaceae bacterium]